jgi:hypothetical protein
MIRNLVGIQDQEHMNRIVVPQEISQQLSRLVAVEDKIL